MNLTLTDDESGYFRRFVIERLQNMRMQDTWIEDNSILARCQYNEDEERRRKKESEVLATLKEKLEITEEELEFLII